MTEGNEEGNIGSCTDIHAVIYRCSSDTFTSYRFRTVLLTGSAAATRLPRLASSLYGSVEKTAAYHL
jgi:hypothetical protein